MDLKGAETFIMDKLRRELPSGRTYHSLAHVEDVCAEAIRIAGTEGVNGSDLALLRTAALFHDSGFTEQDLHHEEAGCVIARRELPAFGYSLEQIERICRMIMATKVPQDPKDQLERILCDADLDYLGREDFFAVGHTLFNELRTYGVLRTEQEWNRLQLRFLEGHRFFTTTNQRLREPLKQEHLQQVERWLQENP